MSGGTQEREVSEQPTAIIRVDWPPLTEQQVAELKKRFAAILASPSYARKWQRATLRTLPWHTRLRLWCTHQRDGIAIWLACHDHPGTAEAVWRLTGAWRRSAK